VTPIHAEIGPRTVELALLGNRTLQSLVRGNFVCFPSQAPVFGQKSRRDLQWRLAVLYFVRGWSTRSIAERYGLTRERCGQIISDWRIRAVALGYIEDVTPEGTDLTRLAASHTTTAVSSQSAKLRQSKTGIQVKPPGTVEDTQIPIQAATARDPAISRTSFPISAGARSPSILR
jgi:hypothetical protein